MWSHVFCFWVNFTAAAMRASGEASASGTCLVFGACVSLTKQLLLVLLQLWFLASATALAPASDDCLQINC